MSIYRDRVPYTYYLYWIIDGRIHQYFGVRFGKGCNPDDFWKSYFTSSKTVKEYRKKYGEPYFRIDGIWNTPKEAKERETRVLKLFGAATNPLWINQNNSDGKFYHCGPKNKEHCEKIRKAKTGKKLSESHKNSMSIAMSGSKNPFFGKKHPPEVLEKISKTHKGKIITDKHKQAISNKLKGTRTGKDNPSYDSRVFHWSNGTEYFSGTKYELAKTRNLNCGQLGRIVNDRIKTHSGWYLIDSPECPL